MTDERFRAMAEIAPIMVWMSGPDKRCTYVNRRWLEFTGRPIEMELGDGWADSIHPDDRAHCLSTYVGAFDRRESFKVEYRLRRHDGEYRWVLDAGVPMFRRDGSFGGYLGSAVDVSDQKAAQEILSALHHKLTDAHEQERARIGRELHDDIVQRLALLAIELDRFGQTLPNRDPDLSLRVQAMSSHVAALGRDVQAISYRLNTSKLDYLGISAAAAAFCQEMADLRKVTIDFQSEGIPDQVPRDVALGLFRVLQEAVTNAIRHSGASHLTVTLRGSIDEISLEVEDSGSGFHLDSALRSRGIGLGSMRERVHLLRGELSIDSRIGEGTSVRVRVPLDADHPARSVDTASSFR